MLGKALLFASPYDDPERDERSEGDGGDERPRRGLSLVRALLRARRTQS
jgi:hypothetical protein